MKKIIFLFTLLLSMTVRSQELLVFFQDPIETCDSSGTQSCLNIGVEGMNGSIIDLFFTNINDLNDLIQFGVPNDSESVPVEYCASFTVGATYEIKAIDFLGERESNTFQHTILGCSVIDIDSDGYTADVDCNDRDATINPGASEICDNKDNDCNNLKDDTLPTNTYYWDADQDGYGNPNLTFTGCDRGGRYVLLSGDCDDGDPLINPGADEICGDGIDNNCNEEIDEGCETCPDADIDGTCDIDDGCPNDPNKIAPGDCGCGTPETDTDGDGTSDCLDNCPNDANKTEPGTCGCDTADTDSDGDGTPDCNDQCPNDANKTEPGNCGCGTVDTDSDSDGTPDCSDNCPTDASKTEPGTCGCGTADTDSDSDGVPDCNDLCPNDATNTCNDCTSGDSDGDGICNDTDNCPDLANPNQEPDTDCDGVPTTLDCNDNDPTITTLNTTDSDGDGTPDCLDNCPNDRNKTEPGDCGCGNRDNDRDGDGVADCNDLEVNSPCPTFVDSNGVSIDSDGDSVPDCDDLCEGFDDNLDDDGDKIPDGCDNNPYCRGDKLAICHENKGRYTTLCVSPQQLTRHQNHPNDNLNGPCETIEAQKIGLNKNSISEENGFRVYPNPITSEGLKIKFSERLTNQQFTVTLYHLNGRKLIEKVYKNNTNTDTYPLNFNLETLEKGVFILKIQDGNKTYYTRIIK